MLYQNIKTCVLGRSQSEPADKGGAKMGMVKGIPRTVAVVDESEERDRYTPWLHREVQGRVAGPVVQLRFISLFPWSSADQQQ